MKTKQKHTPGPWAVPGDGHETMRDDGKTPLRHLSVWAGDIKTGADLFNVAGVNIPLGHGWDDPTSRANAALIAAAPELLAACKAMDQALQKRQTKSALEVQAHLMIRAAILKAEGGI